MKSAEERRCGCMKRILITGAESYIGTSFARYIQANYPDWFVDTVDMIDGTWREKDFSGYDSVFHVAGIAHRKETKKNAPLYFSVNCHLAAATAQKAKNEGVRQFVFLSSMSVYGMSTGEITRQTQPAPKSNYGISKWEAEQQLAQLENDSFAVAILRPPMVYGKDCKGNFQRVIKLVKKLPVFPKVNNLRSVIYMDNLSACVAWIIESGSRGLFLPQDPRYTNISQMAMHIADSMGKKLRLSTFLGLCVKCMLPFVSVAQKAFGTLTYAHEEQPWEAAVTSQQDAVKNSV